MFSLVGRRLDKIPFSTLFSYNTVLESVFSAPARKDALVVEVAGAEPMCYSFGRLRKDVLAVANVIVQRRELLAKIQRMPSLCWLQPPRPDNVRSVYSNEKGGVLSCDFLKDDGTYNLAITGNAGYAFVVSLLAAWSLNQMAVPMSASQKYAGELSYILGHSKSRAVLGDTWAFEDKFPADYKNLLVRELECGGWPTCRSATSSTHHVETMFDLDSLLDSVEAQREKEEETGTLLQPEHIPAKAESRKINDAHDVIDRLELEKAADAKRCEARRQSMMSEQFKENNAVTHAADGDAGEMYYDTENLHSLNPVHRRWVEDPRSRPGWNDDCLMLYTSGTTAKPKGVVHTHGTVRNMVNVLQDVWQWSSDDTILHMLPMHHIHGLVNILLCSLASGARCVITKFDDPIRIARRLERGDITLLMGVPTLYTKLIAAINEKMSPIEKRGFKTAVSQSVRLIVSGSAALPTPTLHAFHELTGHILLERYGMTEIGMALGQPLRPVTRRVPGTVGQALPTVQTYVFNNPEETVTDEGGEKADGKGKPAEYDTVGRLGVSSKSVFDRYWDNPAATKKELVVNSSGQRFFDTGDTVGVKMFNSDCDSVVYTILGRTSVDIIKSSGFKLSALEIEAALLTFRDIFYEVAVVGCKDEVKGQSVVAIASLQAAALRKWNVPDNFNHYESPELTQELSAVVHEVLAYYKCPARYIIVPEVPRNTTGKVNKGALRSMFNLV
ncbi:long-chain-fatty-acid-CoA ligase, putative [Trypanosoma equiperdum]|uniref:Long-chain-fatty-acid-CoA ligase, putative n=1 Tax=Trypanosoma equiperdum TaxID=5694 RepID=A0A1G4IBK2_TRYEQ|nr:long-chain-fatty-acid-CoA ligase, putative [Trypanosoma equiperdum]